MKLTIQNTFLTENTADSILENTRRQVREAVYSYTNPKQPKKPEVLHVSQEMAGELGISKKETTSGLF